MPDYGSRRSFPGWEPGAPPASEIPPVQWHALTRLKANGGVDWVREIVPAPNPSDSDEPICAVGGGVGVEGGVVFGIFSGDKPFGEVEKFLWLYRYDERGHQAEKVELGRQILLRTDPGNDLIMDKEGRLWLTAYPTRAGEETSNLVQVWRMPPPV